ncbi:MAG: type II toxin-antitoxin system RelB/DinJ family antitoxin [Gammaproteobacteria bacterium]
MAKREEARARIDAELKHNVEAVLAKLGLSVSEAIRIYFRMIEIHRGLPFEIKIPNEETAAVFRDTDQGKNLKRFDNADELFNDLGL